MLRQLCVIFVAGSFCSHAIGGMFLQPQTTILPGTTVKFDMVVKNETLGVGDLTYDFNSIGIEFCPPTNGVTFSNVGSNGIEKSGATDNSDWLILTLGDGAGIANTAGGSLTLTPGDMLTFGTVSMDFPLNYGGIFSVTLNETLNLTLNGVNATSDPPETDPPANGSTTAWAYDPNPPFGKNDQNIPGSHFPATFVFVPEPSPVLLFAFVCCVVGCRRYTQKLAAA